MHAIPYLAVAAIVAPAFAIASEPSHDLDETLAARLINLQNQNRTPQIQIAMILEESGKTGLRNVTRAVAIHPVLEQGGKVRRARSYVFNWSPTYGWFLWEQREERGSDAVWIWSESQGEVVIR